MPAFQKTRKTGSGSGLSDEPGFFMHICIGTVLLDHLVVDPEQEERGAHCPTNSAWWSLPVVLRMREPKMEAKAAPRKTLLGSLAE
jgi:hypothetical protein